ncbi:MAG: hypothetical protein KDA85_05545, partial [Planctomycetaceae bacterium]|nr:hypothetical protein [Planctomycetaceae bacterium]
MQLPATTCQKSPERVILCVPRSSGISVCLLALMVGMLLAGCRVYPEPQRKSVTELYLEALAASANTPEHTLGLNPSQVPRADVPTGSPRPDLSPQPAPFAPPTAGGDSPAGAYTSSQGVALQDRDGFNLLPPRMREHEAPTPAQHDRDTDGVTRQAVPVVSAVPILPAPTAPDPVSVPVANADVTTAPESSAPATPVPPVPPGPAKSAENTQLPETSSPQSPFPTLPPNSVPMAPRVTPLPSVNPPSAVPSIPAESSPEQASPPPPAPVRPQLAPGEIPIPLSDAAGDANNASRGRRKSPGPSWAPPAATTVDSSPEFKVEIRPASKAGGPTIIPSSQPRNLPTPDEAGSGPSTIPPQTSHRVPFGEQNPDQLPQLTAGINRRAGDRKAGQIAGNSAAGTNRIPQGHRAEPAVGVVHTNSTQRESRSSVVTVADWTVAPDPKADLKVNSESVPPAVAPIAQERPVAPTASQSATAMLTPGEAPVLVTDIFEDTDVRQALQSLAAQAGVAIIVDEQVSGVVTTVIEDQTFDAALRKVLLPLGLVYRCNENQEYLVAVPDPSSALFSMVADRAEFQPSHISPEELFKLLPEREQKFVTVIDKRNRLVIEAPAEIRDSILRRLEAS